MYLCVSATNASWEYLPSHDERIQPRTFTIWALFEYGWFSDTFIGMMLLIVLPVKLLPDKEQVPIICVYIYIYAYLIYSCVYMYVYIYIYHIYIYICIIPLPVMSESGHGRLWLPEQCRPQQEETEIEIIVQKKFHKPNNNNEWTPKSRKQAKQWNTRVITHQLYCVPSRDERIRQRTSLACWANRKHLQQWTCK